MRVTKNTPLPLDERVRRNITAELARQGETPAVLRDVLEQAGISLSNDTIRRRMETGDWKVTELRAIANHVDLEGVDSLLE